MSASTPAGVLVAGSANLDMVVRAAHVPAPGETVLGRDASQHPGGKGANQAVACARATAADTAMLLALGDDAAAACLQHALQQAGVALHLVRAPGHATGVAFVCIGDDAENAITVAPGANLTLRAEHLPALHGVGHMLLQLETPIDTVQAYAAAARAAGVQVVLNAAPAQALPDALLAAVDVLVVNEGELAALAAHRGVVVDDTLARLRSLAVACVVVTLGRRGAYAWCEDALVLQPAFAVQAVDTTGAGDAFCGSLVGTLAQGEALPSALRHAVATAALACTAVGAQSALPSQAQVLAFLRAQPAANAASLAALADYAGLHRPRVAAALPLSTESIP